MKKSLAVLMAALMSIMSLGITNVYAEATVSAIDADREAIYVDFSEAVEDVSVTLKKVVEDLPVEATPTMVDEDSLKVAANLELDTTYQLAITHDGATSIKNFKLNKILSDDFSSYADAVAMRANWFACEGGAQATESEGAISLGDGALVIDGGKNYTPIVYPKDLYATTGEGINRLISFDNKGSAILKSEFSSIKNFVVEYDAKFLAPDQDEYSDDGAGNYIHTSIGAGSEFYGYGLALPRMHGQKIGIYGSNNAATLKDAHDQKFGVNDEFKVKTIVNGKDTKVNINVDGTWLRTLSYTHNKDLFPYLSIRVNGVTIAVDNVYMYYFTDVGVIPDSISVTGYKVENPYLTEHMAKNKYVEISFDQAIDVSAENMQNITFTVDGNAQSFTTSASEDLKTLYVNLPEYAEWERDKKYVIKLEGFMDASGIRETSFERSFRWKTLLADDFTYESDEELRENWFTSQDDVTINIDKDKDAMVLRKISGERYVYPKYYFSQADWKDYYFEYEFAVPETRTTNNSRYSAMLTKGIYRSTGVALRRSFALYLNGTVHNLQASDASYNLSSGALANNLFIGSEYIGNVFYKVRMSYIDGVVEFVHDRTNETGTPNGRLTRYYNTNIDENISGSIFFEPEFDSDIYIKNVKVYKFEDITNISEVDNQESIFEVTHLSRTGTEIKTVTVKKMDEYAGDYVLVTALYDEDGALVACDIKEKEDLTQLDNLVVGGSAEIEINEAITQDARLIKVFLWNGWTDIKPISSLYDLEIFVKQ